MLLLALGLLEFTGVKPCPDPKGEGEAIDDERIIEAVRDWLALLGRWQPALSRARPRLGLRSSVAAADELGSTSWE